MIPPVIRSPLQSVTPSKAAKRLSLLKRGALPEDCVQFITPHCIQALYNLPTTPASAPNNSIAVSGLLNEVANQTDLTVCPLLSPISKLMQTHKLRTDFLETNQLHQSEWYIQHTKPQRRADDGSRDR